MTRRPTIHEALRDKLGREPTNAELKAEVRRILEDGSAEWLRNKLEKGKPI